MSVLLTATKSKLKPKSARPKKKKRTVNFNPTPPISNPKTQVWHWLLEGIATTVMFTKDSNEVWCNGAVLNTIDGFAPDDEDGAHIDFCIMMDETEYQHSARILRSSTPGRYHDEMTHMLFVDGYMVTEHSGQAPEEAYTNISQSEALGAGASSSSNALYTTCLAPIAGALASVPPSYDDLYGSSK